MRRLILSNTMNTRDLGGYPILSGKFTCYNRFIRSDLPSLLSEDDAQTLRNRGITTVVDLRSICEIERKVSFFEKNKGFDYRHCPLFGNGKAPVEEEKIPESYFNMLCDSSSMLNIMKIFADTETGVLFHCTAGKDRTGVISALLLTLVDVPLSDVLVDYQVSYTYIRPMIEKLHLSDPSLPAWVGQSKPEYLSDFLSIFHHEFQSVSNYLLQLGLSTLQIDKIKSKLICY